MKKSSLFIHNQKDRKPRHSGTPGMGTMTPTPLDLCHLACVFASQSVSLSLSLLLLLQILFSFIG